MDDIPSKIYIFNSLMIWIFVAPILVLAVWRIAVQKPWGKSPTWILAIRDGLGLSALPNSVILFAAMLWGVFFAALTISAVFILWGTLVRMFPNGETDATDLRWSMLALAGVIAALGGVIAVPFTFLRTKNSAENTDIEFQGQITDRINKAVEGLGAVKYLKEVVETQKYMLGENGKFLTDENGNGIVAKQPDGTLNVDRQILETSVPNMEVRVGAIYALERIAQDSLRDHVQIMEILCAYIRENSPVSSALPVPDISYLKFGELSSWGDGQALRNTLADRLQIEFGDNIQTRLDIQTAITVLGRRKPRQRQKEAEANNGEAGDMFIFDAPFPPFPEISSLDGEKIIELARSYRGTAGEIHRSFGSYRGQWLDLRRFNGQKYDFAYVCVRGLDFRNAELQGANLSGAELQGANLGHAEMQGANLEDAEMQGANLRGAKMQGADLRGAKMQGANLRGAKMQGADLEGAEMLGTNLWGAKMQGADLAGAKMQGANLWFAKFDVSTNCTATNFYSVAVQYVDFSDLMQFSEHLQDMFGDATVTLPDGQKIDSPDWPAHWPKFEMDRSTFHAEWRKWQDDPYGYVPPEPPMDAGGVLTD